VILPLHPEEIDIRMLVQQSAFTIHGDRSKPLERIGHSRSFLMKFGIPASKKTSLSKELNSLGIWTDTLFPDLENLAKHFATFSFVRRKPKKLKYRHMGAA